MGWVFSCTALQKGIAVIPLEVAENGEAVVAHAYLGHAGRAAGAKEKVVLSEQVML